MSHITGVWQSVATNIFRRDRKGKRGGGVALYVRGSFDCVEVNNGDDRIEFYG